MDRRHGLHRRLAIALGSALALAGIASTALYLSGGSPPGLPGSPREASPSGEASIRRFCSQHHAVPPPEVLPRSVWLKEIELMYGIGGNPPEGGIGVPPRELVLAHYQGRAPERIDPPRGRPDLGPGPLRLRRWSFTPRDAPGPPAVGDVRLLRGAEPRSLDLLFSDARRGQVFRKKLFPEEAPAAVLGSVPNPSRLEVADLDRDGIPDILVSNLGSFEAYDHEKGSVVWLRGQTGGGFTPAVLAEGLGRVTDAKTADLDGDGDLDLAVAVFGWRTSGAIDYFQNRTRDWKRPSFFPVPLDRRPGGMEVSIADLDRDGRPDIVALVSQNTETIEAFLNRGPREPFQVETIWASEHPIWGSSGIEVVDLDGDGDLDVLFANGDTLDNGLLLPWQGVRWLENRGEFPFTERLFEPFPGCYRARAADLDGDGDLDIVACAFLPFQTEAERRDLGLQSILWLEQTAPGVFARHGIESHRCDYPTLDVGDIDGDGDMDVVLGSFVLDPAKPGTADSWITVLENLRR